MQPRACGVPPVSEGFAPEKSKLWENGHHTAVGARTVTKVDTRGRVYLPGALRRAAGLGTNTVVEIETRRGQVILTEQHTAVATSSRGIITEKASGTDGNAMLGRFLAKEAREELHAIGGR